MRCLCLWRLRSTSRQEPCTALWCTNSHLKMVKHRWLAQCSPLKRWIRHQMLNGATCEIWSQRMTCNSWSQRLFSSRWVALKSRGIQCWLFLRNLSMTLCTCRIAPCSRRGHPAWASTYNAIITTLNSLSLRAVLLVLSTFRNRMCLRPICSTWSQGHQLRVSLAADPRLHWRSMSDAFLILINL